MKTTATEDTISLELDLPHAPARVWRTLVDPALLGRWLLPVVEGCPEAGGPFRLQAPPQPGWDGRVDCRALEVEPERRIRWGWVVGELDTEVTFEVTPAPGGTRLSVRHAGFKPHQRQNLGGARYGWGMMGERLVELLEEVAS